MIAALALALLPAQLAPAAPFPHILADAPTIERVAPGVQYGQYDLVTDAGPIVVHVVAVAPHRADLHLDTVLADDALASPGERVSAMARRSGAVAGINGDYFDIGNTNAPTNVVVSHGTLERSPRARAALVITRDGFPQITELSFVGQLHLADRTVGIDALNVMPPPGDGIALLTPAFGSVAPRANLTLVALTPTDGTPPFATYRVTGILDNTVAQPPGYYAAIGLNAYGSAGVPNVGDTVAATGDLTPIPLANVAAAIGGGPLILSDGAWNDDPDGPSGGEYDRRIPSSGAAIGSDGTLYLIEVDGREPERSVGVTRREFAALMASLGAVRGMALDGGGSSTLAVRTLGSAAPSLVNTPSDGSERPVADGIFVYSDAPTGPPATIVAQPNALRALVGARVPFRLSAIDANDHVVPLGTPATMRVEPATLGNIENGAFVANAPGNGALLVDAGTLHARIPLEVSGDPARVEILPTHPNVAENASLQLQARAYDARGFALALPAALPWRAQGATIGADGSLHAATHDAVVSLLLGDHLANARVTVGSHAIALAFAEHVRFFTAPRGGEGSASAGPCQGCVTLQYALGPGERAAYALGELALPVGSIGIAFDVQDDGSGAHLKIALRNAINEARYLGAVTLDRPGWRHVVVRFPPELAQPAHLTAIYVIGPPGDASGSIVLRDVRVLVAGSP
ncbi:MAG: phosphodiester glycosidase family protein [bacterium]|nr:phosphodiester glycosidase family protein [bacterium]